MPGMIVIGVDPGLTGGLAVVADTGDAQLVDLPVMPTGRDGVVRNRIDGRALADVLLRQVPPGVPVFGVLELIGPRPRDGKASTPTEASLHVTRGIVLGVLDVLRIRTLEVTPQAWQKWYGFSKANKNASREHGAELYPGVADQLRLVKHHNRAEALLIAHYGLRRLLS